MKVPRFFIYDMIDLMMARKDESMDLKPRPKLDN